MELIREKKDDACKCPADIAICDNLLQRLILPTLARVNKTAIKSVCYSNDGISFAVSSIAFSLASVNCCLFFNSGMRAVDLV